MLTKSQVINAIQKSLIAYKTEVLDGLYTNQNAFSNVKVGSTTIAADSKTDTLTISAGSNITLTPNATSDTLTIAAKDTVYTHPTYTSKTSGMYKVTVDGTGHVSAADPITKADITGLGIPGSNTNTAAVLDTTSTAALTTSNSESLLNGTVSLHKISKTGSYGDLLNKPSSFTPASHAHGNIANGGTLGVASSIVVTDANKKIATTAVASLTELGYLSGVTGAT